MQEQRQRVKIVDSREPEDIRMKLLETGWEQKQLYSGDFMFLSQEFKKVGITRKSTEDLFGSIGDRFSKQLEEMLDFYDINVLLVEGSWSKLSTSDSIIGKGRIEHFTWDLVWNYIHRFMAKGFILELTTNEGHTIHRLNNLFALYQKSFSTSANSRSFTDDRVLAFPSGCRGQTAMNCIEFFGSIRGTANASVEDIKIIKGIGDKKANSIFEHFNKGTNDAVINKISELKRAEKVLESKEGVELQGRML